MILRPLVVPAPKLILIGFARICSLGQPIIYSQSHKQILKSVDSLGKLGRFRRQLKIVCNSETFWLIKSE
jgi:hypothetical protein